MREQGLGNSEQKADFVSWHPLNKIGTKKALPS
jgi:hypothetical protein